MEDFIAGLIGGELKTKLTCYKFLDFMFWVLILRHNWIDCWPSFRYYQSFNAD